MKNKTFKPLNFAYLTAVFFLLACMVATPSLQLLAGAATAALIGGTLTAFMPNMGGSLRAIQVEVWQNVIEEELFKNNEFLMHSVDASDNVLGGKVVHIPQSGGSGNVVKNRAVYPAVARQRTDTDVIYVLDHYSTDPVHILDAEQAELSYDKTASVLREDLDKLKEETAEEILYSWLHSGAHGTYAATAFPAGQVLSTTGADTGVASAPSATGARKKYTETDLQRMQTKFRNDKRWFEGRMYSLLDPVALADLFPADSIVTKTAMQNVTEAERRMGVIYKLQGWNIMVRSSVARLNTGGTVLAPGAAGAATDDGACLFWYDQAVERAVGEIKAYETLGAAEWYGDVYSFMVRMGGRARRAGYEGIALLKQAKTA